MIKKIKQFINRKLKLYHWYSIKIVYKKRDKEIFNAIRTVGVTHKSQIVSHRDLLKYHAPDIVKDLKKYLCNGKFHIEPICYLGYFKADRK